MESQVQIAESNLARIHIVARTKPVEREPANMDELEMRIAAAVRSWADGFRGALLARFDEAYALKLYDAYGQAFPAAYTEDFSGDEAACRRVLPGGRRQGSQAALPGHLPARSAAQGEILPQDIPQRRTPSPSRTCCPCWRTWD